MELKEMEAALEAVLFAAGEPVGVERLCLGLETDRPTLDAVAQRLMDQYSYERRGLRLLRLDASYQLCSAPEYADYVRKTLESRKPARLSQPALEVLAIIAYYQPVTRAYVDQVRGVDSSYTVGLLLERDLIEESGRLAVPGRPILYRTTKTFLRSFGLSSLEELPELPSGTQEGDQMTLKLEEAVAKLKAEEAGEAPEVCWLATADGAAYAEADKPLDRLTDLLSEDAKYATIYERILGLTAQESGASMPTINEAVDTDELLKSPRLYAPHFIDKLEKCDAVEWRDKSWRITEVGRAGQRIVADLVAAQSAPEAQAQADKATHDAQ